MWCPVAFSDDLRWSVFTHEDARDRLRFGESSESMGRGRLVFLDAEVRSIDGERRCAPRLQARLDGALQRLAGSHDGS